MPGLGRTSVQVAVNQLISLWESAQVELHGQYSVERMFKFKAYSDTKSVGHALTVLLITPLPCLAAATCLDLIPLQPPDVGSLRSSEFWVRALIMTWLIIFSVLEHLRWYVHRLPISRAQIIGMSAFVASGGTAYTFALSLVIGFPVPFTICFGGVMSCVLLVVSCSACWREFLRQHPSVRVDLYHYALIVSIQVGMTYIYPIFNYVFITLSSSAQSMFALTLPLIKLGIKNWISYVFRHTEDYKPEVVVFNVDVFHSLFVTLCMQRSTSMNTTVLLMIIDFVQAWLSLHDIDKFVRTLTALQMQIQYGHDSMRLNGPTSCFSRLDRESLALIDTAKYMLETTRNLIQIAKIRRRSYSIPVNCTIVVPHRPANIVMPTQNGMFQRPRSHQTNLSIYPIGPATSLVFNSNEDQRQQQSFSPQTMESVWEFSLQSGLRWQLSDAEKKNILTLSGADKVKFVRHLLRVLYITEFVLLIEFIEVMTPILYCEFIDTSDSYMLECSPIHLAIA